MHSVDDFETFAERFYSPSISRYIYSQPSSAVQKIGGIEGRRAKTRHAEAAEGEKVTGCGGRRLLAARL